MPVLLGERRIAVFHYNRMNGKISIINKNNTYYKYRINKYLQLRYSRVERLKNNYIYGSKFG